MVNSNQSNWCLNNQRGASFTSFVGLGKEAFLLHTNHTHCRPLDDVIPPQSSSPEATQRRRSKPRALLVDDPDESDDEGDVEASPLVLQDR